MHLINTDNIPEGDRLAAAESVVKDLLLNLLYRDYDKDYFLFLLKHSLSLEVEEKKRVIDSFIILSGYQIQELHQILEDEQKEFTSLYVREKETLDRLIQVRAQEWLEICKWYLARSLGGAGTITEREEDVCS